MTHADQIKAYIPDGGSILDVGSGKGGFLADMAEAGFKAFGIEMYLPYIETARKAAEKRGVSVTIAHGSAEKLPFESGFFDFVNCAEVTEHVEDPVQTCAEIVRVLKPGGKAYVSFHNRFGWHDYHYHLYCINWMPRFLTEPVLRLLKKQKQDSGGIGRQKLTTMHYYRYGEVKKLISHLGFNVRDIRMAKIKSRFGSLSVFVAAAYVLALRPLYYNTFHLLLEKPVSEPLSYK